LSRGVLLDTNVVGEFGRRDGDPQVDRWLAAQDEEQIFVPSIAMGELAFGIARLPGGRRKEGLQAWFSHLLDAMDGRLLALDLDAALIWGRLRAQLQRDGSEKPGLDLQIAAIALSRNLVMVTGNERHFAGFGLDIINPWAEPPDRTGP
jgi:predicted nucleic acid-binding protein